VDLRSSEGIREKDLLVAKGEENAEWAMKKLYGSMRFGCLLLELVVLATEKMQYKG